MNLSVYLFGDLGSGYTQYPDDYTNTIFETFYKNAQAITQIGIHREGDLMYYGYIRKLEESNYIGLCAIVNGKLIHQVDSIFSIFEGVIESMVRNGYLIHFNDKGDITAKLNQLYENEEEINLITSNIQSSFNRIESASKDLPPVSYSTSKDSVKSFSTQDDESEIIKSSYTNGYTFIYKSKGFNTTQMNSYKTVITQKDNEISALREECTNIEAIYKAIISKKDNEISEIKKDYSSQIDNYKNIISHIESETSELKKSYSSQINSYKDIIAQMENKMLELKKIHSVQIGSDTDIVPPLKDTISELKEKLPQAKNETISQTRTQNDISTEQYDKSDAVKAVIVVISVTISIIAWAEEATIIGIIFFSFSVFFGLYTLYNLK